MLIIDPTETRSKVNNVDYQQGFFERIIILTEKDLDNLPAVLCGQGVDLVIVPRDLSKVEHSEVLISTLSRNGQVLKLK